MGYRAFAQVLFYDAVVDAGLLQAEDALVQRCAMGGALGEGESVILLLAERDPQT